MNRLWAGLPLVLLASNVIAFGCQSVIGLEDRSLEIGEGSGGKGDTGTGGTSQAGDTSDAGATGMTPCQEYCALTTANCVNDCPASNRACSRDLAVYSSLLVCMATCPSFELGDMENPEGNTLACRIEQARFAGAIPDEAWAHCPAAGPGGAGVCGDNCESYCSLMDSFCSAKFPQYIDPECLTQCRGLRDADDDPGMDAVASRYGANLHHDADFLQCRLVHATSASVAPDTHCWHATIEPKPRTEAELNPCADPEGTAPRCQDYCRLIMVACPDDLAVYDDESQCLKACEELEAGDAVDGAGKNTIGCRKNHAYNAMLGGADLHCPHAGPGGNGVCGANCDSYCTLLAAACEDDFTTEEECLSECADLDGAVAGSSYAITSVVDGDNFQCRLRAVTRAFEDPASCESAIGQGDCSD